MKNKIVISFLTLFLYANTEMHEILKIPVLVHHYLELDDNNNSESFIGFLNEHYNNNNSHNDTDNKHHDHQKLPFKTNDCATVHTVLAFTNANNLFVGQFEYCTVKVISIYNVLIHSSSFQNKILQPPQFI
ncbi:MAG TPA: hypothetical protein VFM99_08670 [Chitinophagales bacterium]|nr:hypothetical protein [Chitinophagales bacterium]